MSKLNRGPLTEEELATVRWDYCDDESDTGRTIIRLAEMVRNQRNDKKRGRYGDAEKDEADVRFLIDKLDTLLRNARYWFDGAPKQSIGAILECRGIAKELEEHFPTPPPPAPKMVTGQIVTESTNMTTA